MNEKKGIVKMSADNKVSAYEAATEKSGLAGQFETLIRRYRILSFLLFLLPVSLTIIFAFALALTPAVLLLLGTHQLNSSWPVLAQAFSYALAAAIGFFLYGISIIFLMPLIYRLNPIKPVVFRGPWYSIETMSWYIYNALLYIPRYTFLEFITPTPLLNLFYKMMGMKIGKNTIINTTNISDACFITLGDRVVIGGSATLFAHYGQKGFLVIDPIVIEDDVNIGLKASIMGNVHIEKGAFVSAHSVVYPKTHIKAGEHYCGIAAPTT